MTCTLHKGFGEENYVPTQKGRLNDLPMRNSFSDLFTIQFLDYEYEVNNVMKNCPGESKTAIGMRLKSITPDDGTDPTVDAQI